MNHRPRLVPLLTALGLTLAGCTGVVPRHSLGSSPTPAPVVGQAPRVTPPSTEANITRLTTSILERSQFAHHPLDADLAGKFLDSYLDALDGTHSVFLQSDLREFDRYRATLAQTTRATGDTSPARAILTRYLERLEQQAKFVNRALENAKFEFTGHERYSLDREHTERPADLGSAETLWMQELRAEYLQEKLAGAVPEKVVGTLRRRYAQQLATLRGLGNEEVLDLYLNALAHVYDPHSDYLGHEQMVSLSIAMNLALFGIGATLETSDGYCEIRALLPGGPAARSNQLKPGDRIIAVAQADKPAVEIKNMPLSRTVELIRGPKGTALTLTILAEGAPEGSLPKLVPLVRDEIKLEDEQVSAKIVDLPRPDGKPLRVGVLNLPSFYAEMGDHVGSEHRSATTDVAHLLAKLSAEKIQGLLIDIRQNGGGSLNEAISLTGLFIGQGPVVQTLSPSGAVKVDADRDPAEQYAGPLVVLTSRLSASASEILTGALQDYGRAVVVGDSATFGKGTVQSVLPLARVMDDAGLKYDYDPGALKVTIQKFYRPNGASTQLRGVASDIVLPSTSDFSDVSESALKNPLPWDSVMPAPHERYGLVERYLERLRESSSVRVAHERAFSVLAEEIAQVQKNLTQKSVSLNEEERRHEIASSDARHAEREQASKNLTTRGSATYEITLGNAGVAGLPAQAAPSTPTPSAAPKSARGGSGKHRLARGPDDDIILNEAEQILADYVALQAREH